MSLALPPRPRRGLRCRLHMHRWGEVEHRHWECLRCWEPASRCENCGGEHDPTVLTICIVTTRPRDP